MSNVFDILYERGFIEQITHEKEVKEYTSDANVSMTLLEGNHNMHGDYEMRFSDLPDDCILRDTNTVVYGAVLHTSLNGTSKD